MRTSKGTIVFLVFVALGAPCARLAGGSQESVTGSAADGRHMRCVVKVTASPAVMPLDFGVVEAMLRSDAVAGRAARNVLGAELDRGERLILIRPLGGGGDQGDNLHMPPSESADAGAGTGAGQRVVLLALGIDLPAEAQPVARRLANAVVENLRHALEEAFTVHAESIRTRLDEARTDRDAAQAAFTKAVQETVPQAMDESGLNPADAAVYKQLDRMVDLSTLNVETPFGDAVERIRRLTEPPLNIVVLWRELSANAEITPSTAIHMGGLANVKLGVGLGNLLTAMSNPQLDIRLDYIVDSGVITIATDLSLPPKRMEKRVHEVPALVRASGRTDELKMIIESAIEPDSWLDLSETGEGTIVTSGDGKLVVWQTREVHQGIHELLRSIALQFPVPTPLDAPEETLRKLLQSLPSDRDRLEKEIHWLRERSAALSREKNDAERKTMEDSLHDARGELLAVIRDLEAMEINLSRKESNSPEARRLGEIIDRIARCRDKCGKSIPAPKGSFDTGGGMASLAPWPGLPVVVPNEEQGLSMWLAARESERAEIGRRIAEIQNTLAGRTRFDPEVQEIQLAARRLEQANIRVHQLEQQLADLQPGSVAVIGGGL